VEHDEDIKIEDIDLFENYMVLYERKKSFPEIRVFQFNNENGTILNSHYVPLYSGSSKICSIQPGVNIDFKKKKFRFEYSSPITPTKVYEYNMESKQLNCLSEMKPNGVSHNADDFVSQRIFVPSSKDQSVVIPLTVSYMKEKVALNGKSPLLLRVYGAYGHNSEAEWKSEEAYLMKHGWIIAIAHVRGGGELGKQWHINGKENLKFNSFYDFIDVVQYLINNSYTSSSLLAAVGHSAGGLVIGSSLNLGVGYSLKAVIAKVPFVDVLSSMLDTSLPLTTHEYDEWGDPTNKSVYNYIRSYDPFVNLSSSNIYPNMLVTASIVDIRVPHWGVLKWVIKMRNLKKDNNLLLLKVDNMGHFGEGGQFSRLYDIAFDYAFLYKSLNIPYKPLSENKR
jgi:oligopeptidase B